MRLDDDKCVKQVAEMDEANMSWEFHVLGVWQNEAGELRWGEDSGCSCPVPWEGTSWDDLQPVATTSDFWDIVHKFPATLTDKAKFERDVRAALDRARQ